MAVEKIINRIIIFGIIVLIIIFAIMHTPWGEAKRVERIRESLLSEQFSGVVLRVYKNRQEHNCPTIDIQEGGSHKTKSFELTFVTNYHEIMGELNPGDSIIKREGKLEIEIFREDNISFTMPLTPISPKY